MAQKYIKCPKDPELQYLHEICETVMRKHNLRHWCKTCDCFKEEGPATGDIKPE